MLRLCLQRIRHLALIRIIWGPSMGSFGVIPLKHLRGFGPAVGGYSEVVSSSSSVLECHLLALVPSSAVVPTSITR